MRHQYIVSFFAERSKCSTSLTFFSFKIALAALKLIYLDTYKIFFNTLTHGHSIKGDNQDSERTGTISSNYTDLYLLAEFSRIV